MAAAPVFPNDQQQQGTPEVHQARAPLPPPAPLVAGLLPTRSDPLVAPQNSLPLTRLVGSSRSSGGSGRRLVGQGAGLRVGLTSLEERAEICGGAGGRRRTPGHRALGREPRARGRSFLLTNHNQWTEGNFNLCLGIHFSDDYFPIYGRPVGAARRTFGGGMSRILFIFQRTNECRSSFFFLHYDF